MEKYGRDTQEGVYGENVMLYERICSHNIKI